MLRKHVTLCRNSPLQGKNVLMINWCQLALFCRVHEKLRAAETREGASFGALFGSALLLGIISRRRVYYEAIEYDKERNAGIISHFGCSAKMVAAAADTVCSMEVFWVSEIVLDHNMNVLGSNSFAIYWEKYFSRISFNKNPIAVIVVYAVGFEK